MVAAILSIAGYSINDTIVVFDRIREELKINPSGSLRDVINSAINKVFSRSMMTSLTAFLAAFALYLPFQRARRHRLIRVFRQEWGLSPHAYFEQVRIHRARRLLKEGTPIADVAADLGVLKISQP